MVWMSAGTAAAQIEFLLANTGTIARSGLYYCILSSLLVIHPTILQFIVEMLAAL
jgi:hypothetical protein